MVRSRTGQPARRVPLGGRPRRPRYRCDHRVLCRLARDGGSNCTSPSVGRRSSSSLRGPSDHRRLAQLYTVAAQCFAVGRIDDAIRYGESARPRIERGGYRRHPVRLRGINRHGAPTWPAPEKTAMMVPQRDRARFRQPPHFRERSLGLGSHHSGPSERGNAAVEGLPAAADTVRQSASQGIGVDFAQLGLHATSTPPRHTTPCRRALTSLVTAATGTSKQPITWSLKDCSQPRRSDRGDRSRWSGDTRSYHDSGSFLLVPGPLALIAVLLDRFGRYEPAAVIMGVADQPGPRTTFPEIDSAIAHLREALGDQTYESLARTERR